MDVHLFLTRADTQEPVLAGGVSRDEALLAASEPPAGPRATVLPGDRILADYGDDPGQLDLQRWGVVVPRGAHGQELLQRVKGLCDKRAADQGAEALVYEVDPGMSAEQTDRWIHNDYIARVGGVTARLPRYLLILGGPEQVSWAMQQQLASVAMPGRLVFQDAEGRPDLEGYTAYVHKVLRWESEGARREPRVVFYSVQDGDGATDAGREHLIQPSLELLRRQGGAGELRPIGVDGPAVRGAALGEHRDRMVEDCRREATILFSVTHGLGAGTWTSAAAQRARQGALVIDRKQIMTAEDVERGRFLPGGAWFFFACFSAGTPEKSLYERWVASLHRMGRLLATPEEMVLCAPVDKVPFAAALPQAALRNPEGPLGVIGHVDLALSFSFFRKEYVSPDEKGRAYPDRFADMVTSLVRGRRLGVAFDMVARGFREIDSALTSRYAASEERAASPSDPGSAAAAKNERASLSALWLARQDVHSFVLLGDPAARLPLRGRPASAGAEPEQSATAIMEEAVLEHLRGAPIGEVAARLGVGDEELTRWVDVFLEGARQALSRLGS